MKYCFIIIKNIHAKKSKIFFFFFKQHKYNISILFVSFDHGSIDLKKSAYRQNPSNRFPHKYIIIYLFIVINATRTNDAVRKVVELFKPPLPLRIARKS